MYNIKTDKTHITAKKIYTNISLLIDKDTWDRLNFRYNTYIT